MRFKQLTRADLLRAIERLYLVYWDDKYMNLPSERELARQLRIKWEGLLPKISDLRVGAGPLGFGVRITGTWKG